MDNTYYFGDFSCPRWEDLPDIDLYMDQVLTLISKHFGIFSNDPDAKTTSSMINNYVKAGIVPAPKKKRYGKEHLACIFMICVLKRVLSINQIGDLISKLKRDHGINEIYVLFCSEFDRSVSYIDSILSHKDENYETDTGRTDSVLALHCAVNSFANAVLSDILIGVHEDVPEKKEKSKDKKSKSEKKNGDSTTHE